MELEGTLGDRGTWVWTTCRSCYPANAPAGSQTCDLSITSVAMKNLDNQIDWLIEHGFTSAPTQYRLYSRRLDNQMWKKWISTKLKLYNTCILPIFLYGFECWADTKRDVLKIDVLYQQCMWKLLGIKCVEWRGEMDNQATTPVSAIVQTRCFSLFGHIAWMPDETDAKIF